MTKLRLQIIEEFIRWNIMRIEHDKVNSTAKKTRDRAEERFLALRTICQEAKFGDIFDRIQEGRSL